MNGQMDRRTERRLRYLWPIWVAQQDGEVVQGQMVDLSSEAAAFTYTGETQGLGPHQWVRARFSVPSYGPDDSFDLTDYVRTCQVCRVDPVHANVRRVVVRFQEALPLHPGEQDQSRSKAFGYLEPAPV